MQNKYTGDIGDFGKYGMLRFLCNRDIQLGVNWYLVPDELHTSDGKFTGYLNDKPENNRCFKACDPELYQGLQSIVNKGTRDVLQVQQHNILPSGTIFYDTILSYKGIQGQTERSIYRNSWVLGGINKLKNCDIVFLDPDNGLEVPSYSPTNDKGTKFVYYNEITDYYKNGQSLIIYNHRDRKPESDYLKRIIKIYDYIKCKDIFCLRFYRFSVRDYIFVLQSEHYKILRPRVDEMLKSSWGRHFSYFELNLTTQHPHFLCFPP